VSETKSGGKVRERRGYTRKKGRKGEKRMKIEGYKTGVVILEKTALNFF